MNHHEDKTSLHSNLGNPFLPRYKILGDKIITFTCQLHEHKLQYQILPSDISKLEDQEVIDIELPESMRQHYRFDCQFVQ